MPGLDAVPQLRPPLTRGASAQLTARTLTQTGDNSLAEQSTGELGPGRLRTAGPQLMNIIEHTIDKSVILK